MEPIRSQALAPLVLACAYVAGCGAGPRPVPEVVEEVETEIAELVARPDGFLDRTQEELVAGLRQRLSSYGTILDGIERLRGGCPDRSDAELRARLGRLSHDVLTLETTLDPSWRAQREPVVDESARLERDLIRAWDEARG